MCFGSEIRLMKDLMRDQWWNQTREGKIAVPFKDKKEAAVKNYTSGFVLLGAESG